MIYLVTIENKPIKKRMRFLVEATGPDQVREKFDNSVFPTIGVTMEEVVVIKDWTPWPPNFKEQDQ